MSSASRRRIEFVVNDQPVSAFIDDSDLLIDLLRDDFGLTSVKRSCDMEICGACTVLIDNLPLSSCTTLAYEANGKAVTTVEGMAPGGALHPLQQAFVAHGALQCGFCTPGFLLTLKSFLDRHPVPTREELVEELGGNICRCTGYFKIIEAAEAVIAAHAEGGAWESGTPER